MANNFLLPFKQRMITFPIISPIYLNLVIKTYEDIDKSADIDEIVEMYLK